jgi:hypothetical protein
MFPAINQRHRYGKRYRTRPGVGVAHVIQERRVDSEQAAARERPVDSAKGRVDGSR